MARAPHLLHIFPTFVAGGAQVRVTDLMNAFAGAFTHTLLALDGDYAARERLDPSLDVEFLTAPPRAGSLATARRLRALFSARRPDLLLSYNFGAIDALLGGRGLGLAAIHHEDGFHADEAHRLKRRRNWLRRLALPAAEHLVVISRTLERIALEVWRQPRERVLYVPNGIDLERHARAAAPSGVRESLGLAPTTLLIGSVGHLRAEKNVARLLGAAERALGAGVDLALLVLGDGPQRAELEARAARGALAGRVHFVGFQADPRAHYRAMDALALSSDTEQMPMAILEAMAAGLPVLSSDVGDVRAMLPQASQGLVVPLGPDCEAGLAAGFARLAGDAALRAELGAANLERARERFGRAEMLRTYRELYGRAAGAAGPS